MARPHARAAELSGDQTGGRLDCSASSVRTLTIKSHRRRHGSIWRRLGRVVALGAAGFVIASLSVAVLYRLVPPPATPLMLVRLAEGYSLEKDWRPLQRISPELVRAVIASEDQKFCQHHGFDWQAIGTAWRLYAKGGAHLLGASTISMQTAKNTFLWPGRDWLRKGLEAYFTAVIELVWGKRRIIEVYLNIAEWGPGIYGAEAASEHYFRKPASALSRTEAARLAAILPDPLEWSAARPSPRVLGRAAFIRAQIPNLPVDEPLPCG